MQIIHLVIYVVYLYVGIVAGIEEAGGDDILRSERTTREIHTRTKRIQEITRQVKTNTRNNKASQNAYKK